MKILNIAHRGYSGKFDENTIIAFKKAIEYGADGIETDVQLSKDGIPVIIHDETLDRTTNGRGYVKDYTLKELKQLRINSIHHILKLKKEMNKNYNKEEETYFNEHAYELIPTLREVLDIFKDSKMLYLNLELKNSVIEYEKLEEKVMDLINEYDIKDRVIISSFNHNSLVKVRKMDNTILLGALTDSTLANVPSYLNSIDVQCYHPFYPSILNKEYIREIKRGGIMVNPYTINDEESMKLCIANGVDSLITNEVEVLNRIRDICL